ncbi:MAG TPA: COX15/CtaA family protein [Pyrinomonadaceae bacterium]|jgi:cytochrome c oxidase assembly protein subunit 15|nr:COX15/CtaA family protein [Pyrinomonadaceae bacterium]
MVGREKLTAFARYAWLVLGWNLLVILWGVFLRASKSGDGCGQHWLTCQGEVIPSAPQLKTIIEYSHRITSFLAFVSVVVLVIWTVRRFAKGSPIRRTAVLSLVFVVTEGLVGAGLVLTGNTADTLTAARPFWMAGHLINTFILLAFLTLTARYAGGGSRVSFLHEPKALVAIAAGALAVFIVGITGSIAALASMLFPSGTLSEGLAADLSSTSHTLLRLRLLHPIIAILTSVLLIFTTSWLSKVAKDAATKRWANILALLVVGQLAFGAATLLTLAPIVMQLGHLFLADAIWISYVLLTANFLALTGLRVAEIAGSDRDVP